MEQIRIAYYKLAQKFHPDKNDGDNFFEEHFKEIQEAYDTLSKPGKKDIYDATFFPGRDLNQKNGFEEHQKKENVDFIQPIIVNGIRIPELKMFFVEGGSFEMGVNPAHEVLLDDFFIGKYPVTQSQWLSVMGKENNEFLQFFTGENTVTCNNCPDCPVENVSWDDTIKFIKKLNKLTGKSYRLLTEAEWEYSAIGGRRSKGYLYSGSNDINEVAWHRENTPPLIIRRSINHYPEESNSRKVQKAGLKKPNELGIYDMSGNVSEWCSDWYDHNYYANSPKLNPQGPLSGTHSKICRGGNRQSQTFYGECLIKNRNKKAKNERQFTTGFRLALSSY